MRLHIRNDFHNTSVTVCSKTGSISRQVMHRVKWVLCSISDCQCSPWNSVVDEQGRRHCLEENYDGTYSVRTYE
jgi:hypothetical protein